MISNCRMLEFKRFSGNLGALTAVEGERDIPFPVRRVYYITDVPGDATRGFHAHQALEQVLICLHGTIKIRVKTPFEEDTITLSENSTGLYIGNMIWREMFDFTPGAVLMVLASDYYSEDEYIRNYKEYLREATTYFGGENK